MSTIDLNCDLGESFGAYTLGSDKAVLPYITSANVACGFHAGDPLVMEETVKLCVSNHVAVGAHPGYPDLMGFGRRNLAASPKEVSAYMKYQVGALWAFCKSNDILLSHVKPHGALYNMAAKDYSLAIAIAEAIASIDENLILLGLSNSEMIKAADAAGIRSANEVFADRGYEEDGSLVARSKQGAMITDETLAIERVVRMVTESKVKTVNGKDISIKADSVCLHGDGEKAVIFAKRINEALVAAQVALKRL